MHRTLAGRIGKEDCARCAGARMGLGNDGIGLKKHWERLDRVHHFRPSTRLQGYDKQLGGEDVADPDLRGNLLRGWRKIPLMLTK
jgi:hypothetical protein